MTDALESYYANHGTTERWPYSIYHGPIHDYLKWATSNLPDRSSCLNVGCGFFENYPELKGNLNWHACDIDSRCVDVVEKRYPEVKVKLVDGLPDYRDETFDFLFAKEVIEHIEQPGRWLRQLFRLVKKKGRLVLTTPNYGVSPLPLVEYTLLELIARKKGFSRFNIHPNKYNTKKLKRELDSSLGDAACFRVITLSHKMVLLADIVKP